MILKVFTPDPAAGPDGGVKVEELNSETVTDQKLAALGITRAAFAAPADPLDALAARVAAIEEKLGIKN